MKLPDVNDMYPQVEPTPCQPCDSDSCTHSLYKGQEVIEHAGYLYCDSQCLLDQMHREGNANRVIIGE